MDNVTVTVLTIAIPTGLHARPAAQFVRLAAAFASQAKISARGRSADAKSMLAVLSLGVAGGTEVVLAVDGPDEQDCSAALAAFLQGDGHHPAG